MIQGKPFSFPESQSRRISSLICNSAPSKAGWSLQLLTNHLLFIGIRWLLEVDGNSGKLRAEVSFFTVLPSTFRESASCIFFFMEDIQRGNSNSNSLWSSLGKSLFNGIAVKERLKGDISKVVDPRRVFSESPFYAPDWEL